MSNKKPAAHYLREMKRFAEIRNEHLSPSQETELATKKRYVRINGGGLRVVSLCGVNPCGAVQGHKTLKTASGIHRAKGGDVGEVTEPKNKKGEHAVQAALIEHAKRWPETLPALLHLENQCEQLRFVNDELAIDFVEADGRTKSIRADVVLAGKQGTEWFPVFIELKNARQKKTLVGQLADAADALTSDREVSAAFADFVVAAARLDEDAPFDVSRAIKVLIWPKNRGPEQFHDFGAATSAVEFDVDEAAGWRERDDQPVLRFTAAGRKPPIAGN